MRVGILGGGQLAQMMAMAAKPLNIQTYCLDPAADACAKRYTDVIHAPFHDHTALRQLADHADVITFETENIPLESIDFIRQFKPVNPSRLAIATAQDRLLEKQLCQQLAIPTPMFRAVGSQQALEDALADIGTPAILKTRRFGYDGKGQVVIRHAHEAPEAWATLKNTNAILEQMIPFDYEVSMIATQNHQSHQAFYPLVRNHHEHGILRYSIAPWDTPALFEQAKSIVQKLLAHFAYVGVFTVEFFVLNNQVMVNEMAPRVHNSGHWTIEGAITSQFENHLRAITGNPLGETSANHYNVMFNHIGEQPTLADISNIANTHYHDYGKQPRPGRKIGHVTLSLTERHKQQTCLKQLQSYYPKYTIDPADVA